LPPCLLDSYALLEARMFFFEKKNQKTFTSLGRVLPGKAEAETDKSFLLLFFKKEGLPSEPGQGALPA
jgi:hypothetical protein